MIQRQTGFGKKQTDKKPYKPRPLKSYNQESRTWLQQAEQNVEQWKKQQTEQAWLNQSAESTHKQNDRWEAKEKASVLPSTFQWSPEIAEVYKKREQWEDINTMANNQFQASVKNAWGQFPPSDARLTSYLQMIKTKAKSYPLQMKSFYKPVNSFANPPLDFGLKTKRPLLSLSMDHGPLVTCQKK